MKVYAIIGDDCIGSFVYGIFSNKEKAEEEKVKCESRVRYEMKEFDCDETFYTIKEYNIIE